ncbi:MAG: hypothetical protein AAFZ58_05570 [Pseudomonadota bacterium]
MPAEQRAAVLPPAIIFVPGMKPKPPPPQHRHEVWRCLLEGIRRVDPAFGAVLGHHEDILELAAWTHLFYDEFRDIGLDQPSIEAALAQPAPTEDDRREARSLRNRMLRAFYLMGDMVPFLIPRLAGENMRVTLGDVRRYARNEDNIGRSIRRNLRLPLRKAWHSHRKVLLIGHSLGSVIAWDTLWEMSRVDGVGGHVDLFLTIGSPLGQNVIQRNLKGAREHGRRRYPSNVRHWANVSAVGELTALDHQFANDYAEMLRYGLVETLVDFRVYTHYRQDGDLLVHSEYGYLLATETATLIGEFLKSHWPQEDAARAAPPAAGQLTTSVE